MTAQTATGHITQDADTVPAKPGHKIGQLMSAVTAAQLGAVERELSARRGEHSPTGVLLCSCGYGADNPTRSDAHLADNPDHEPYDQP
jgi:hypothetical protein